MIKSKNLLIKQGAVYGVKYPLKMIGDGAQLSAVTNLKNTQNKRRKIVQNAKLNNFSPEARIAIKEFEAWQMRVFAKNAKKGWRFFQPDTVDKPTPRSSYEAWGAQYKRDDLEKREDRYQKILTCIFAVVLIVLSII